MASWVLSAIFSAWAVRNARWNIGQSSVGMKPAGTSWNWVVAAGMDARSFCIVGSNALQAGQPYENTSVTSTLPGGGVSRLAVSATV
jgi:hypothetical protein